MNFRYKTRPNHFEKGEFTDYTHADPDVILDLFTSNYWGNGYSEKFADIAVCDQNDRIVFVQLFRGQVCDIFFIPSDTNFHYFTKSNFDLAHQILTMFLAGEIEEVTRRLKKTREDHDFVMGDLINKRFTYQMTPSRVIRETWWMWFNVPVGSAIVGLGLMDLGNWLAIPVILAGLILSLPGLLLFYNYWKDNQHLQVTISRGRDEIHVLTSVREKILKKSDITAVVIFCMPSSKFGWTDYGFTRIEFASGDVVNMTNLIIDQFMIEIKFPGLEDKIKSIEKPVALIEIKTNLI